MRKSLVYTIVAVFFLSCASAPKEIVNTDNKASKPSSGGEGIRIAVLQPKGVNIPEDQEWFLAMMQSSLTGDFNRFSKMPVLDRQHLDTILKEQELSMSGDFSEADYIKIGNLTNAQYIIIGSLTKTVQNRFMLEMAITNPETGERRASFGPKQYTASDIQGIFAAKDAAYELLAQVGVEFSPVDKQCLYEMTQSTVSAETALSKGAGLAFLTKQDI
jgi:TolB-like protein